MGIEVKNLIKSFDKKVVLNDISFKVDDGKILSIVGFSGSGKSTVLKLISGLIEKDSGEIITTGGDVAMVFQYSALFDSLNVFDNISFALDCKIVIKTLFKVIKQADIENESSKDKKETAPLFNGKN